MLRVLDISAPLRVMLVMVFLSVACSGNESSESMLDASLVDATADAAEDATVDDAAIDGAATQDSAVSSSSGSVRVAIAEGLELEVQDASDGDAAKRAHVLASLRIDTAGPERRALGAVVATRFIDRSAAALPDRLYQQVSIRCIGPGEPAAAIDPVTGAKGPSISQIENILADDQLSLRPRGLIDFPEAGSYVCDVRYVLRTSYSFPASDRVVTGAGGQLSVSPALADWAQQCFWPRRLNNQPNECAEGVAAKGVLLDFGETRTFVPITNLVVPTGGEAIVQADAYLTTCAGTGGASAELCPSDVTSELSGVRSRVVVTALGDVSEGCEAMLQPDEPVARRVISRRAHHAPLYNQTRLKAPVGASCETRYRAALELTVTSGAPVIVHTSGTLLSVFNAEEN